MLEWNGNQIRSELWTLAVMDVVRRAEKEIGRSDYSCLMSSREVFWRHSKEVFQEYKDYFKVITAGSYDKRRIFQFINAEELYSSFVSRVNLDGAELTASLYIFQEEYEDIYREYYLTREISGDEVIEAKLSDNTYLCRSKIEDEQCDFEIIVMLLQDNGIYLLNDSEEWDEDYDYIYYAEGGFVNSVYVSSSHLVNVYLNSRSNTVKKLIEYLLQEITEMNNPEGFILGMKTPKEYDEEFKILYASRPNTMNYKDDAYIYEISKAAYLVVLMDILNKEIQKEGF